MAKKSPKNQLKRPSTADFDNAAPPAITTVTTSQPASTPQADDAHVPTITQLSFKFSDFLTIANKEDIKKFLRFAATTPEGANLIYLWKRAYDEGYQNGRKAVLQDLGRKMEEKFEEGVQKGMNLGREEGYTVAKEGFDGIIRKLEAREAPKIGTRDACTQMDSPATFSTSVSTQTEATTYQHLEISYPACVDASPPPELFKNRKNTKIHSTSEILPNIASFSSQTPPVIVLDPAPCSTTTTAIETQSTTASFTQKQPKVEKSLISEELEHFNWANDALELPIWYTAPTKQPRDLSGLRSSISLKNPFSSLQRRRRKFNKNTKPHIFNSKPPYYHYQTFPGSHFHSKNPHHHSQPPLSASLNWDQDPRLLDLSKALKALGWVRQPG